jgi:hypothetical protein
MSLSMNKLKPVPEVFPVADSILHRDWVIGSQQV